MNINSIPDLFQSKIRIAIVSCLLKGDKTFKELKSITGASDGNISVHAKKLEVAEYISIKKGFHKNKPLTTYSLTSKGRQEFEDYISVLENLLKDSMS